MSVLFIGVFLLAAWQRDESFASGQVTNDVGAFRIHNFIINSSETLRFAKVNITSKVENLADRDREFTFRIRIPKSAFISGFVLKIGEVETRAIVAEKDQAGDIYLEARQNNATAGHVTQQTSVQDDKDRDIFNIAVNIPRAVTVEFRLQYYEFLERHAGVYSQTFYIYPRALVENLQIVSDYTERQDFTVFDYKLPYSDTQFVSVQQEGLADGYYRRRLDWRPQLPAGETDVKEEDEAALEVTYELEPLENGGHVIFNEDGDFAHYFSSVCNISQVLRKRIIFVIDISGSMKGVAMEQVRTAISIILDELRSDDFFNIILFSSNVRVYTNGFNAATEYNKERARLYVQENVIASGSTNMNLALTTAVSLFNRTSSSSADARFAQTIVFLTDGAPTAGETNRDRIRQNLRQGNYYGGVECCRSSVFTVAFSKSPEITFLRQLTDDHLGRLRVVRESLGYEIGQALVGLYAEIHNPYYRNVRFSFFSDGEEVSQDDITQSFFLQYDCGGEIVVGGHVAPGSTVETQVEVEGAEKRHMFTTIPTLRSSTLDADMLSHLVAYKQVKELLKKASSSTNKTFQARAITAATELSLKMEFVTPVTSLVVSLFPPQSNVKNRETKIGNIVSGTRSSTSLSSGFDDFDKFFDAKNIQEELFPNNAYCLVAAKFLVHMLFCITQLL